mmetsp:Transcript_30908/g.35714  ORF Transcript_30908/g.35714 Transcript_30908/m.35714 type:complete len:260 (-) Transcript_30908:483-1262(-)
MRFDLLNREAVDQGVVFLWFRTRLYQRLDRGWWWWCCSGCGWCGGRGIGIRACEGLGYGSSLVCVWGEGGGAGNRGGHGGGLECGPGLRRGSGRMMAIHIPGFRNPTRNSGPWSRCRQLPHGLRHLRHTRIARRRLGLQRRLRRQRGRREIPGQNVFLGCRSGGLGTAPLRGFFGVHARRDQGCLVCAEAGGEWCPRGHERLLGLGGLLGLLLVEGYHGLLGGVSVGRDRHTGGLPMEGLRLLLFGEDSLLRLLHLLLL